MRKKKLVLMVPSLEGGGAEKVVVNLVNNLDKKIFDITLIVVNKKGAYQSLIPDNINIVDLKCEHVRNCVFRLLSELNKIEPDCIMSTLEHLNLLLLLLRPLLIGKPKIIVRAANNPSKIFEHHSLLRKNLIYTLYKNVYKGADYVVAQCEDMKKDIVSLFKLSQKSVVVINNPVDLLKIEEQKKEFLPYKDNKINLLSIGRLVPQKGYDILIEALSIVIQQKYDVHLTILGDGPLKNELTQKVSVKRLDEYVTFAGFQKNPYPYYYYADMYILSSRYEGFPNTLLEAIACGTKVVATDCLSGPKEILKNGKYGVLAQVNDSNDLARKIIQYLAENNRTSNRAENYDIKNIVKKYENLFLTV